MSNALRIGIIAPPWGTVPPAGYGGTESVVDRLARGLTSLGHDVLLFTTGDSRCDVDRRHVLERAVPERVGNSMVEIRHVVAAYDELCDVDVVHDNTAVGPLYSWRYPALPVVATNHGPFDPEFNALYRAANERVTMVAISHHQASTASRLRVDAVIHHGVDPDAFAVGDGAGGYFAFLGRMAPEKGAREAALAARRAGVPLRLAGKLREPSEKEYFDESVRPLLGHDVDYVGELDHDAKVALLGGAAAMLNPIQWPEPFGLVMIESLACGTPVIGFACGAAPEIVADGRTGLLCTNIDDLTRQIDLVGTIRRANCRRSVEEWFSTARMCREYESLFDGVVTRSRAA